MPIVSVGELLPSTKDELYVYQFVSMLAFTAIAVVVANVRKNPGANIDFHYVVKNVVVGATLPVSLLLALSPVYPQVVALLGSTQVQLMVFGMVGTILAIYSLVR